MGGTETAPARKMRGWRSRGVDGEDNEGGFLGSGEFGKAADDAQHWH
jgi:hypothetical protein